MRLRCALCVLELCGKRKKGIIEIGTNNHYQLGG